MPSIQGTVTTNRTAVADGSGLTTSVTVSAGSRMAIYAVVCGEGDGTATQAEVSALARDGQSFARVTRVERSDWSWVEIWRLLNPNVNTSNAVITLTENDSHAVGFYVLTDVNQTTPDRTPATTSGSAASGSVTVGSVASDDLLIDGLSIDSTGHNPVPGANQTEQFELDEATGAEAASSTQSGADGGVMSWTWTTSAPFSLAAVAVIHDGGGGGGTTYTKTNIGIMPLTGSGADAVTFVEAGTAISPHTGSGADAMTFVEAGSGVMPLTGSGADFVTFVETGMAILGLTGSGVADMSGGTTYTKDGAAILGFTASGARVVTYTEAGMGVLGLSGSGVREGGTVSAVVTYDQVREQWTVIYYYNS